MYNKKYNWRNTPVNSFTQHFTVEFFQLNLLENLCSNIYTVKSSIMRSQNCDCPPIKRFPFYNNWFKKAIKPMITKHSSTPRVMKNINKTQLPAFWRSNERTCMSQDLFVDWVSNCFILLVENFRIKKNLYSIHFIDSR